MSSTSSQASADSASGSSELVCEQSSSSSLIPSAEPSSPSIGPTSPVTRTSEPSTLPLDLPMSSAEVSPVRTSVSLAVARAFPANVAAYGRITPELLAKYDRGTSSWRTSQRCFIGELETYSATWPRSGMTRNGIAYQLPPLVPLTEEIESGLWPTPLVPNGGRSVAHAEVQGKTFMHKGKKVQLDLAAAVRLWPTPTVKGNHNRAGLSSKSGDGLASAVRFATSTARDFRHPGRSRLERTGGKQGQCLPQQIGGPLNPWWVEWLMGYPLGWTVCEVWEIRSSRRSRKSSAKQS